MTGNVRSIRPLLLVIITLLGFAGILASTPTPDPPPPTETTAEITELDFSPFYGQDYDIQCTGQRPTYSDTRLYGIKLRLSNPLAGDVNIYFTALEDRTLAGDPELTVFYVTIPSGNTRPTKIFTVADGSGDQSMYVPDGAPDPEPRGWWLACTAQCRVRGNKSKGDDEHANVYIQVQSWTTGYVLTGKKTSQRRTVRCQ